MNQVDNALAEMAKQYQRIEQLFNQYKHEMVQGTELQKNAWAMMNESEPAAEQYVEMRKEYRARKGSDGYGNATNDYAYSQYSEAKKAVGDNQWYMQRAIMFSNMAQMHFAKAAAIMADILRRQQALP